MSAPSYSDSPRSATNYLGQNYRFTPTYIRNRNPTVNDLRPKENKGFYPIGSIWVNTSSSGAAYILSNIVSSGGSPQAQWNLLATALGSTQFTPDTGTNPVGGTTVVFTNTSILPAGSLANAIRSNGLGISSIGYQLQYAGSNAGSSTPDNWGVAQFDSNSFGVSSGFVTLNNAGTTGAVTKISGDDSLSVVPSSGIVSLVGSTVLNATNAKPVYCKKNATSIEEIDVQLTTTSSSAAKNINKSGLCHFDSSSFTVDSATGFVSLSGSSGVQTLTGNSGGAISPSAGNINVVGSGSLTTAGSGSTITASLTGLTNHALLVGAGTDTITSVGPSSVANRVLMSQGSSSDPAFSLATYPTITTANQLLYSSSSNTVSGLSTANSGVLTTNSSGVPSITAIATDGQIIIGSTAGSPAAGTITAGTGVSVTNGSNSITVGVSGAVGQTITGNSGGALSPTAGNWNIQGSGSITASGSGSTLTTQLTGLTNHALLVGAGTATITNVGPTSTSGQILQSQGASADPAFSTATYPSTTTNNQILYSSATNTVSGLATANNGVLTTGATGTPAITALSADGQLLIGSASGPPIAATLTAGTNVTITNAANSITIAASGGTSFTWTDQGTNFSAASNNGYFCTAALTATLPASPSQGDTIRIFCDTGSTVTVTANTGQKIRLGSAISALAGTAACAVQGNALNLVYRSSSAVWDAFSAVGSWTIT